MRLAEGQVTLRGALLLLGLWELLDPGQCSHGRPSWRYVSSEVVIPRKQMAHGKGMQVPGWLSYSLRFGGQRHVIHMRRKKLFWPRHLQVVSQDDQRALQIDHPYIPQDCHYLGFLEEIPQSMVTIGTCYGGLEGIMKLDDLAYEIKPLKGSHMFEHVVSEIVADTNATGPTYRLGYKNPPLSKAPISAASRISSKLYASHAGALRGLPISSHSMAFRFNNVTQCMQYLISLGSLVNAMYHNLDIRYYVTALIVYNQGDPTNMRDYGQSSAYHNHFAHHVYHALQGESAFIVIRGGPNDIEFNARENSVCTPYNLVMIGELGRHYLLLSVITSFQIGRTLGLHVDADTCYCQRRTTCIMYRYPVITDVFSNCSIADLHESAGTGNHCLFRQIGHFYNESVTKQRCGDSVVEGSEQCDCGSFKQCYSSECCRTDCTLTPGSACSEGGCCTNCSFSPLGTLCRSIQNICDLPEYCTGETHRCPGDFYLQDGTPCTEEEYCYQGNCTDRSMHCKEIFGRDAVNAEDACYNINRKGSRFGHCRRSTENKVFQSCEEGDVKCGRLQCTNVSHLPRLQDHVSFHQSWISGLRCFGLDEHRSTETTDVGHVRSGTPCAPGRLCSPGSYCNGSLIALNYDCHPEKCSYRGMCNNRRHCHCHIGWGPPLCLSPGPGGSEDSGPPPRRIRAVSQSDDLITYLRLIFGRILALIAAFLFGIATNVRTIQKTKVTEKEYESE
nr:disintegrin and metalloproteinase domain-containing protein 21-like [Loxodonta africana]